MCLEKRIPAAKAVWSADPIYGTAQAVPFVEGLPQP